MRLFKIINRLVNEPTFLFWFYVATGLVPSLCLVFTEPFTFPGKAALVFFPAGLYLVIYSLLRNASKMELFLFPFLILHAFQLVLFYLYGEAVVAVDMFLNLVTTNVSEASELLSSIWPSVVIVCLLYIPAIALAVVGCRRRIHLQWPLRRRFLSVGAALLAFSFMLTWSAENRNTGHFTLHEDVYPVNAVYNLGYAARKWHRSERYFETSRDFTFHAIKRDTTTHREIYVLVIGEAGRAENWSLYGYGRETTPLLESTDGLVAFPNAITQSNTTHKSVPMILSAACAENYDVIFTQKSVLEAFREAGFKTAFISNQIPNRSFTDFFATQADYHRNLRTEDGESLVTKNHLDTELLPVVRQCLDSMSGNLFIVLHTYGSHFKYRERYPEAFSHFVPDQADEIAISNKEQLINAYDNSIRFIDCFLHALIDTLRGTEGCAALYYTSDHGEDLLDDSRNRFLHASPNPTYYQLHIPMFVWMSDAYRSWHPEKATTIRMNATKPIATNAVFHTMLDIAGITTPYFQADLSLANATFRTAERMYLTDHDNPIPVLKAGLKPQDLQKFEALEVFCQ